MNKLVLQFLCKVQAVFGAQFRRAQVRRIEQCGRQGGAKLVRNAGRHFAHGRQAVYTFVLFQGAQVGRNVLNLNHTSEAVLHALGLKGSDAGGGAEMKFIRPVPWLPVFGGVPKGASLQACNELCRRLVEMADMVIFNENHGRRQGIEQDIKPVVGLNQVCAKVFYLSAKGRILLLQSL